MKNVLLLLLLQTTLNLVAQTDVDNINRTEIYLIRTDSTFNERTAKTFRFLTLKDAEVLFGKNYTSKRIYANLFEVNYTEIEFDDGLILDFPDKPQMDKAFTVKSDRYTLLLQNGQRIKVGMKAEDLKRIFPKSFSQKLIISGRLSVLVYFSFLSEGKLYIESSWISFILTEENGVIKEFFTWEAG